MAGGNNRNLLVKSLFAIVTMVVAYFSIVSTMTIYRVGAIERTVNQRAEEIRCNERNIAVLLEKVTTVERLVREIREEISKLQHPAVRTAAGGDTDARRAHPLIKARLLDAESRGHMEPKRGSSASGGTSL